MRRDETHSQIAVSRTNKEQLVVIDFVCQLQGAVGVSHAERFVASNHENYSLASEQAFADPPMILRVHSQGAFVGENADAQFGSDKGAWSYRIPSAYDESARVAVQLRV